MNHDIITAQNIKLSADPRKYKPTNSLHFGYPRNFKPAKLNTLTVGKTIDVLIHLNDLLLIHTNGMLYYVTIIIVNFSRLS